MKGKIKLMAILLGTLLVLQTPFLARAFTVSTWNYDVQDTDNTPGPGPWYADAKGRSGQPCNELLYVHIAWDSVYIYVRWDVNASINKIKSVYYALSIDAVGSLSPAVATHLLQFEADSKGDVTVTVRNASDPSSILWSQTSSSYYSKASITNGTALEGRYPWDEITGVGVGPADIWVIRAESHASTSVPSEVMDYIEVSQNPIPWFTDLTMTLLITTVLVAFYVKKRGALPVKLKA